MTHVRDRATNRLSAFAVRLRGRTRLIAKRAELNARRNRAGTDVLWVDYGWAQLPYTADGDEQELLYHLHEKPWRTKELAVLGPLVREGDTVFDVGANLGFYSAMFAAQMGRHGRVVAFEPARRVFAKLDATIARNALDHVVTVNTGCGSATTESVLRQVSRSTGNASLVVGGAEGETVSLLPLDQIPEALERPPQLIKIDVEGFEFEVLAGARATLSQHRPILYIELCGEYLTSTERSIELLSELGYDTRELAELEWGSVPNGTNFVIHPLSAAD